MNINTQEKIGFIREYLYKEFSAFESALPVSQRYFPAVKTLNPPIPQNLMDQEITRLEADPLAHEASRRLADYSRINIPAGTTVRLFYSDDNIYADYTLTDDISGTLMESSETVYDDTKGTWIDQTRALFIVSVNWPDQIKPVGTTVGINLMVPNDKVHYTNPEEEQLSFEEKVHREITRYRKAPHVSVWDFFNNFYLYWDSQKRNDLLSMHKPESITLKRGSASVIGKTWAQFMAECESVMQEENITEDQLRRALDVTRKDKSTRELPQPSDEYISLLTRLYVTMRKRGYNHHDLTG